MPSQTMKSGATAVRGMPFKSDDDRFENLGEQSAAAERVTEGDSCDGSDGKSDGDLLKSNPRMLEQVAVAKAG